MDSTQSCKTPIILTGPPGCGKSHWIQKYADESRCQLFVCPCRKDRTLRDGRQKLHVWARRTEPAILWLEGADDLTPEAQAFLRRILETHASQTQFILECRDAGKLQEPIRSRCVIRRMMSPSWKELVQFMKSHEHDDEGDIQEIADYLEANEYTYRRAKQCMFLQRQYPDIWRHTCSMRRKEKEEVKKGLQEYSLPEYILAAYSPEALLQSLQIDYEKYGECIELSGSLWAFLGSALFKLKSSPAV